MKPTEAAALLTIAAAFDNRKPDADQAKAWAMALDGLRFEDCRTVIVEHYRKSREWLMPSDVVSGVMRLRRQRLDDFGPIPAIEGADPDDVIGYRRAYVERQRQIADGTYVATEAEAIGTHRSVVAELGHIGHEMPEDERIDRETALAAARAALAAAKHVEVSEESADA